MVNMLNAKKIRHPKIFFFAISILIALPAFYFFPFFLKREVPFQEFSIEGEKVLIVSDLHLENNKRDLSCIGEFLDKNDIGNLVIGGDLFDMKQNTELSDKLINTVKEMLGIRDGKTNRFFYVLSLHDHDPMFKKEKEEMKNGKEEINIVKGILRLNAKNNQSFYVLHGDYLAKDGGIPYLINRFGISLLYEKIVKKAIGAKNGDWAIMGHSHLPGIDYGSRVANTGSWLNRIVSASDTGILLTEGEDLYYKAELIKIPCEE
ncbi:MAG: metallophosphoesterase family protein [Candidatus Pacebacteria bacterium]|nr:metallophosphoesterase family protein [Candidatus Paceibacterota bacterium]